MSKTDWSIAALIAAVGVASSYLLAAAGEPSSLWLWRALGVMP